MHVQSLARTARTDDSAPNLKARLEKASTVGKRLEKLIDQMLDVSRISAGRLRLDPEPVDLSELVREIVERYRDDATVEMALAPDVAGVWDRTRLDQVVSNLLANAIKYGRGNPIRVETLRRGLHAVVRVLDHGIGVAREQQARIFERFERAVGPREFGGFGLGLWIARQIVESMGGTIEVESELGEGSTFTVTVPLEPSLSADAQP
jgi:signal transduction histidine kinase